MSKLRKRNLPRSSNTPLVDQLGSTEHKIRKEIAIMKKLSHPHVVRLLEVIDDPLRYKIYMGAYLYLLSTSLPLVCAVRSVRNRGNIVYACLCMQRGALLLSL